MLMLDLFSGLGGASAGFRDRGWDVVTVDIDPRFNCTHTTDLAAWEYTGATPDIVWASPPCTQFSRSILPWIKDKRTPSLDLLRAALRVIREVDPVWWVVENVRGAIRWFRPLLGDPVMSVGPVFLWGRFPSFTVRPVKAYKQRLSSRRKAERSKIPYPISAALAKACESSFLSVRME